MYTIKPSFYDKFCCTGDKCMLNCCQRWRVIWSDQEAEYYKSVSGRIGEKAKSVVKEEDRYYIVQMDEKGQCPFLNKEGLCDIVLELGEDKLSHTCQSFPRNKICIGELQEYVLSLGCAQVVELVRKQSLPLEFIVEEDNAIGIKLYNDEEIQKILADIAVRNQLIDVLQMQTLPLYFREWYVFYVLDELYKGTGTIEEMLDNTYQQGVYQCIVDECIDRTYQLYAYKNIMKFYKEIMLIVVGQDNRKNDILIKDLYAALEAFDEQDLEYELECLKKKSMDDMWDNIVVYSWYCNAILACEENYMLCNAYMVFVEMIMSRFSFMLYRKKYGQLTKDIENVIISIWGRAIEHGRKNINDFLRMCMEKKIWGRGNLYQMLRME